MKIKPPINDVSVAEFRNVAWQGRVGVSLRSILTGAVLCIFLSIAVSYNLTTIRGSLLAKTHEAMGALALFFFFVAGINILLRLIARAAGPDSTLNSLPFNRSELLVIYVMLAVSSSLSTFGLAVRLPVIITAPYYYTLGTETWQDALSRLGGQLPAWLTVSDPQAARSFYSGLSVRENFWPEFLEIIGQHWLRPLAIWGLLLMSVYGAMVCIAVIIRKQWMEKEILVYPLTKVPLAMVEPDPEGRLINPLFRNRVFWFGFVCPALMSILIAAHNYLPGFPQANQLYWRVYFFNDLFGVSCRIIFSALGFAFLVTREVSFSIWFFALIGFVITGLLRFLGIPFQDYVGGGSSASNALLHHMGQGALLMMVAYSLWTARRHLRDVLAKALGLDPTVDDSNEIMSYRVAVFGLILCTTVMLSWLYSSGMPFLPAVVFIIIAFILFYALSRVVAEAGLTTMLPPSIAPTATVSALGAQTFGPAGLISLALSYVWTSHLRTFVMVPVVNGLKVVEHVKKHRSRLLWAIFLAIGVSFVFSVGLVIYQAYRTGAVTMHGSPFVQKAQEPYRVIHQVMDRFPGPYKAGWLFGLIGAGLMIALRTMRRRCTWWPIHPIGFVFMGMCWAMEQVWLSFLLAWLVKSLVIKYGGPRLYKKVVPFFLGLILGQGVSAASWVAIDFCTGMTDSAPFWL